MLSTSDDYPSPSSKGHSPHEICNNNFCFCNSNFYAPIDEPRKTVGHTPAKQPKNYDEHMKGLINKNRSMCSMNCVARFKEEDLKRRKSPDVSQGSTEAEKQIHSTDLDIISIRTIETVIEDQVMDNRECSPVRYPRDVKIPIYLEKIEPTVAYFFHAKDTLSGIKNSPMKKSKKSTNLVKFRNKWAEPTLKKPLSKCMLLGGDTYKMKVSKQADTEKPVDCSVACDSVPQESNEVQVTIIDDKSLQDSKTTSDFDNITEKLLVSIFENHRNIPAKKAEYYIKEVVKDLYDSKFQDVHPVKALFRSLLEYWLKNTNVNQVKSVMRQTQSIDTQSNRFFTKDKNLSSVHISNVSRPTQFHGMSDMEDRYGFPKTSTIVLKDPPMCQSPTKMSASFEKDKKIQDLERLLKNTVYLCETIRNDPSKQKDIRTTKTLIENIGKPSKKANMNSPADLSNENSNSSTEKIKDTINHLISETSIPPDVAKEFLGAYLNVLLKDEESTSSSSISSNRSTTSKYSQEESLCNVQTEAVVKRVSKSVTTFNSSGCPEKVKYTEASLTEAKSVDAGQMYLKDILDKITTIFSKVKELDEKNRNIDNTTEINNSGVFKENEQKDELGRPVKEYPGKNLIYENCDENTVVIDLTKFDLEHISMFSDPTIQGIMSITIKLKEKPPTIGETDRTHLSLQFAESQKLQKQSKKEYAVDDNWIKYVHSEKKSNEIFQKKSVTPKNLKKSSLCCPKQFDLKPYSSSSDATSKHCKVIHESEHSLDLSFKSSNYFRNESNMAQSFENQGTQSCYMMSFKKELLSSKLLSRKKTNLKECSGILLTRRITSPRRSTSKHTELSIFEKPASRVIDEKFILLLLENLSLLSKNLPSLHRDINNLFLKLRKKHEKILKSCSNIQGLSLLGKIYNEESSGPSKKDAKTQWDVVPYNEPNKEVSTLEKAVNTCSSDKIREKNELRDANISAIDLTLLMNSEVQTLSEELLLKPHRKAPSLTDTPLMTNMAATGSLDSLRLSEMGVKTADNCTSNPNWFQKISTKECSMTTLIKYMLENKKQMARLQTAPREHGDKKKKQVKLQDFVKEMSLLSPAFKVSTQSQTDRKLIRFARENDFNVYPLYVSNNFVTRASSMTDSKVEIKSSDEMKTLYRCTSDSYCSGWIVFFLT